MFRRFAGMILLTGLLAGCRSTQQQPGGVIPPEAAEQVRLLEESDMQSPAESAPPAVSNALPGIEAEPVLSEPAEPAIQDRKDIMVLLKTSKGDIKISLDPEHAPKTVANFLSYVEEGHYDGTIFHRVINGFMIQGGGFDASMTQKSAPRTVENEAKNGLQNVIGSIAMARTPDPHSASAQFFINVADNANLDYPSFDGWGYCVFGRVVEGMDVVNAIKEVPTGSAGRHQNVPVEPVLIESAALIAE